MKLWYVIDPGGIWGVGKGKKAYGEEKVANVSFLECHQGKRERWEKDPKRRGKTCSLRPVIGESRLLCPCLRVGEVETAFF